MALFPAHQYALHVRMVPSLPHQKKDSQDADL